MVSLRCTRAAKFCFWLALISSLQQLAAHTAQKSTKAYLDEYGQWPYLSLADRLAELVEAQEPLHPEDVARLAAAVK